MLKKITKFQTKTIAIVLIFILTFCLIFNNIIGQNEVKADSYRYIYDGNNIDTSKYPGFKEKIDALKSAHPAWKFVIMETGLDWNQAIKAEYAGHWGSPLSLIQGRSGEWICPICGTTTYDNGSWYHASEATIQYYMDARNWLNNGSPYLLQFLQIGYFETTDENIYNALNGTFLYTYENAKIINKACRETNTNPYYIIARLIQEQGTAGGATWRMESDGTYYYNLFNIGASGKGSATIIANALAKAKDKGWTSVESSLTGGINCLFAEYVNYKQDTMYLNKFDVESYNGTYSHQYMQNIEAPTSEALLMYNKISGTNLLDQSLTFVIPVFYNMPTQASSSPDGNIEIVTKNIKLQDGHTGYTIHAQPSRNSYAVGSVSDSSVIVLSDERYENGWYRIILTDGTAGYIQYNPSDYPNTWEETSDVTNCNEQVTLTGDGVYLRAGPGKVEPVVTTLSLGQTVTRIDNSGRYTYDGVTWDRVKLSDGRQGFISNQYLKLVDYSETFTISADGGLFLRDNPDGTSIRLLSNGTTVTRTEIANEKVDGYYWDKVITPDGAIGYVAREYLRDKNGNVPNGITINTKETNSKKDDITKTIKMEPNVDILNLKAEYGDDISVTKTDGTVVSNGQIGTGYKIKVNGTEYTAVKMGDVNGDGLIKATDYMTIKNYIMNGGNLSDEKTKAADVNGDGLIKATDYMKIKNYIMGTNEINI